MEMGKGQGLLIFCIGLVLLTAAILIFITLNGWGNWVADYPMTISIDSLPAEAQAQASVIVTAYQVFFSPLLGQVGGYMQVIGNFVGSLLTLISLAVSATGLRIIRNA